MPGFWKLITSSHHPIVAAGLVIVLVVFGVHAALDAAAFALRIVTVAIDELGDQVDGVRSAAQDAGRAARTLYDRALGRPPRHER